MNKLKLFTIINLLSTLFIVQNNQCMFRSSMTRKIMPTAMLKIAKSKNLHSESQEAKAKIQIKSATNQENTSKNTTTEEQLQTIIKNQQKVYDELNKKLNRIIDEQDDAHTWIVDFLEAGFIMTGIVMFQNWTQGTKLNEIEDDVRKIKNK